MWRLLVLLLPAAMALVLVLLQLGEGWLGELLGAVVVEGATLFPGAFLSSTAICSERPLPAPLCYPVPAVGTWVGSCALMLSPGGPASQSCWVHWGCLVSLA